MNEYPIPENRVWKLDMANHPHKYIPQERVLNNPKFLMKDLEKTARNYITAEGEEKKNLEIDIMGNLMALGIFSPDKNAAVFKKLDARSKNYRLNQYAQMIDLANNN